MTIVLPCYNEGAHVLQEIERITAAMDASELTYELLCIDDASTDDTLDVLRHAQRTYPHLRILPFRRNGGSGTARRIGTQQARGEIVVWTDADMTYENERIPELVRDPARRRHLRPGRRRAHHRGGHPQVGRGCPRSG